MSGASSAGAGCFTYRVSQLWARWRWGHWDDDVGEDAVVPACRGFCSVPGPSQTVQTAELWSVILALQANDGVHLGVDNLGVVRHAGRMLDGGVSSRPSELLQDGDLLLLIERMLHLQGLGTVRISKVKGHADEALVRVGTVRDLDSLVHNGADEASDFGRRRVPRWRHYSFPALFLIATSRAVVSHDGGAGTSLDPMVWSVGGAPKRRRVAVRDRLLDRLIFSLVLG